MMYSQQHGKVSLHCEFEFSHLDPDPLKSRVTFADKQCADDFKKKLSRRLNSMFEYGNVAHDPRSSFKSAETRMTPKFLRCKRIGISWRSVSTGRRCIVRIIGRIRSTIGDWVHGYALFSSITQLHSTYPQTPTSLGQDQERSRVGNAWAN